MLTEDIKYIIADYIERLFSADKYEYSSELDDAINDLNYLSDGYNDSLFDMIINHIEEEYGEDFNYDNLDDEDKNIIDEWCSELALAQIEYLNENCDISDEFENSNDDYEC